MSRQALVRVDGAQYSVPRSLVKQPGDRLRGGGLRAGVARGTVTVVKRPRGSRTVKYQHYLDGYEEGPGGAKRPS